MKITDFRPESDKNPVWRVEFDQFTWANGETGALTKDILINGKVGVIIGKTNNSTNAITYTTTIYDEDSYELYTKADWAENATEVVTLTADTKVLLPPGSKVTITPSGDPGTSGGTFDLTFIGE